VIIQAVYDLWYTLYISLKHMSFTLSLYSFVYIQYRSFSSEYFTPKLLLLCREEVKKTQTKHFITHLVGVIIRNIQILLRIWQKLIVWYLLRYRSWILSDIAQIAYYPINNEMWNKIFLKCSIYVNVMIQIDSTTRIKLIYDNEYPFKAHFIAIM